MLSTKNLVTNIREVPETWVFEYYAGLEVRLNGDKVNIKSLFNSGDKKPSMFIFWSEKYSKYWFHDFSSGKSGDAIKLVQELFNHCYGVSLSYGEACRKICEDYSNFKLTNKYVALSTQRANKYRVTAYELRGWNVLDAGYWTSFNISSVLLSNYFVKPLEQFTMTSIVDPADSFEVTGQYIYGYFTPAGDLYKIYRPKRQENKFIKCRDYIQGIDQLEDRKCLIITASLKDGLSLKSLGLDLDFIAPDSENVLLPQKTILELYDRYKGNLYPLLDNDEAGVKAMKKYRDLYNLSPILLRISKDLSDSTRDKGPLIVRDHLVPLIDRKLNLLMAA